MQSRRPGEASVQYGDLRGESAADIADALGDLNAVGKSLGFKVTGTAVGLRVYSGDTLVDKVFVTLQVFGGGSWDEIKAACDASGGSLTVTEHFKEVPLLEFARCFKRLNVGFFVRDTDVRILQAKPPQQNSWASLGSGNCPS